MNVGEGARHFQHDLELLRSQLLDMSVLAEELLRTAVEALVEGDAAKADSVILGDRELDAAEVEVDEAGINLLARHQPFARDLRLITMILRIANDLERVGDHAVNIAETVHHLGAVPAPLSRFPQIEEMAQIGRDMLTQALDSFVRGDSASAREVCRRDDLVDSLHNTGFRSLLTLMTEDPRWVGTGMSLILVGRNLERVADLATNVAEDVVYMVEGKSIKHGADRDEQ
ncbi:MAG: phosphate transport system regulatory protein PhoU [Gemmatimonadales bacterium]|nr:MAG: phosphate transport system regulatory protein PhoU [Gemmatimonadales bacterium]